MRSGNAEQAATELNKLLLNGFGKSEIGFVTGEILIEQQRIDEAGQVYSEILSTDANFPEVHARLSFAYYETGDAQSAFREAKAALR